MEIVLLWLDDLDDIVFAGLMRWESLRVSFLTAGFVSSLALGCSVLLGTALDWVPLLLAIAFSSVAFWTVAAAVVLLSKQVEDAPA